MRQCGCDIDPVGTAQRFSCCAPGRTAIDSRRGGALAALLTLLALPMAPQHSLAQTQVRILEPTEQISTQTLGGERVRKLVGQVRLEIDGRTISCDSAFQYLERPLVIGFNVAISDERDEIRADTLRFNTRTEIATFSGNVHILQEGSTVISQMAEMNLETSDAHFIGQVQWMDSTRYVEADEAFVNREENSTRLMGRVYGEEPAEGRRFSADSMKADSSGFTSLQGRVWLMTIQTSTQASAQTASDDSAVVTGRATADTTILTSNQVEIWDTQQERRLRSIGATRVWSSMLSSVSDTLDHDRRSGSYLLLGDPMVWKDQLQLSSVWIRAQVVQDTIRGLNAGPRPVLVMQDSVTGRLHQMTGDTLAASFTDGELSELTLLRQTEVIFHRTSDRKEPDGAMKMTTAGPIRLTFLQGEIRSIQGREGIDGLYLEEDEGPQELQVTGFRWDPERRPTRVEGPGRRFSELYRIFTATDGAPAQSQ